MELKGLKRGLKHLQDAGLHIKNIVTDRHGYDKEIHARGSPRQEPLLRCVACG